MEKRFKKLLGLEPDIQPGDESQMANNPRNWLADKVNPVLDEYINPVLPESVQFAIPKMTVADEKQYYADLPENMAGMGSIKQVIPSQRFGNIIRVMDEAPKGYGKVTVVPSKADLIAEAQKAKILKGK